MYYSPTTIASNIAAKIKNILKVKTELAKTEDVKNIKNYLRELNNLNKWKISEIIKHNFGAMIT